MDEQNYASTTGENSTVKLVRCRNYLCSVVFPDQQFLKVLLVLNRQAFLVGKMQQANEAERC